MDENDKLTVDEKPKVEILTKKEEGSSHFLPVTKCIVAVFLCLVVLGCAVFSKISVIKVAESFTEQENRGRVFIFLTLILMLPQMVSFVCSAWGSVRYSNRPWPTKGAVAVTIVCSILEVFGLCMFTLGTLTKKVKLSGSESVAVMNCITLVPTIWQVLKICGRTEQQRIQHQGKSAVLFFFCAFVQIAGFVVVIIFSKGSKLKHSSILSLLLISVAWLPKLRKLQIKPRLALDEGAEEENPSRPGEFLHRKTARTKATMIGEGIKLLITPFVSLLMAWIFGNIDIKDIHSGFKALGDNHDEVFSYFLVNIFTSFIGYVFSIVACSMAIQKSSFALPLTLTTPLSITLLSVSSSCKYFIRSCDNNIEMMLPLAVCVWLAQFLSTTYYVWRSQDFIMAKESQLFWVPSYNGVLLEQNVLLNRKNGLTDEFYVNQEKITKDSRVFICTTMYHEADYEMEQLLYSLHRVDMACRASNRWIESHIWFDGAVKRDVLNTYVLQLISLVEKTMGVPLHASTKFETPYGMELRWRLPGGMNFHIHLKDNLKVKNKKRWSQVMYMSYVLDYKTKQNGAREEDTYILTTDADINFNADSVEALLDLMMRDPKVGAVCGRTHPLGSGPLVWYQTFDYAIGHWFQKVANHVLGSVLCCPGCFSVYRAKALRDVLPLYATTADQAVDFLTKDMGEDRWLCTLMVQAGWRLEYCAAAENRTYCPEDFDEFFKQRRRWIPSTLANLSLLISEWSTTVSNNDSVSFPFILYQAANVFSTLISPATVILIIVGGLQYGLGVDGITSLVLLILLTFFFALICLFTSQDVQLKTAKILTVVFALLMGAVFVGLIEQIVQSAAKNNSSSSVVPTSKAHPTRNTTLTFGKNVFYDRRIVDGQLSFGKPTKNSSSSSSSSKSRGPFLGIGVSSWYFFGLVGVFMVTALCHPTEAHCLLHGTWYLLCLPSGYLFLIIYSVCNLTDRSWGTRETTTKSDGGESLQKIISDKLLWFCRGCKDAEPSREPAAEPIHREDGISTAESSSGSGEESDTTPPLETEQHEEEANEIQDRSNVDEEAGSPTHRSGYPKSALKNKKGGKIISSSSADSEEFRFPGQRTVRFASKLPKANTHMSVGDWLEGKMKQYTGNFQENGYDDTSFIVGMKEKDLEDIGVEVRGHRKKLMHEIEKLPAVEVDHNVPDIVDNWLCDIGLDEYKLHFKNSGYIEPRDLEDLKVMNALDLKAIANEDLGILKKAHLVKFSLAVALLQYPSAIERKIREARTVINNGKLLHLKDENEDYGKEFEFWTRLRQARLLPESKAFGKHSELTEKLGALRDSVVLCLTVANLLWIILIMSLAEKTNLQVAGANPLGLSFLVVFGIIIVVQFLTMLWHRVSTSLHMLARAPFRVGRTGVKVWSFNDNDLPPLPSGEELERIRMKRVRNTLRRRPHTRNVPPSGEELEKRDKNTLPRRPHTSNLVQSQEASTDSDSENAPLLPQNNSNSRKAYRPTSPTLAV